MNTKKKKNNNKNCCDDLIQIDESAILISEHRLSLMSVWYKSSGCISEQ